MAYGARAPSTVLGGDVFAVSIVGSLACAALLLCALPVGAALAQQRLSVGVQPYHEPLRLVRLYEPFAIHLRSQLDAPVLVHTRESFTRFWASVGQGEFDVVITVPHLARWAELHAGYRAVAQFTAELRFVALQRDDTDLSMLAAQRPIRVAVPDRNAMSVELMRGWTEARLAGAEQEVISFHSQINTAIAVLHGEADVGFVTSLALAHLSADQRAALSVQELDAPAAHLIVLCRTAGRAGFCERVSAALDVFEQDERGQAFFRSSGLLGLGPVADLARYDALLRRMGLRDAGLPQ